MDDRIALIVGRLILQESLKIDDLVNQLRRLQAENETLKQQVQADIQTENLGD